MSPYVAPPRCPDGLLASELPDWAKVVWLAVRSTQGGNGRAWADYATYGERCGKSYDMVRKAVSRLKRDGWIEQLEPASRSSAPVLRCTAPGAAGDAPDEPLKGENPVPEGENHVPTFSPKGENPVPERREPRSHPYKEESVQESVQDDDADAGASGEAWVDADGEPSGGGAPLADGSPPEADTPEALHLPPNVAAYADAIADWRAQPEPEQARRALVALRAGNLPPASLHRGLAERRSRHGPLALTAALVLVDHEAESRSHRSRLRFLDSVLDSISDHARRSRLAPTDLAPAAPGDRDGRRRNAPQPPGGKRAGGPGVRRGGTSGGSSPAEHYDSLLDSLALLRARREQAHG